MLELLESALRSESKLAEPNLFHTLPLAMIQMNRDCKRRTHKSPVNTYWRRSVDTARVSQAAGVTPPVKAS